MISYGKQSIDNDDIKNVIKVLKSDYLTQGPTVKKFENSLGRYFKARYVCAVSSGTAALHLVGKALNGLIIYNYNYSCFFFICKFHRIFKCKD